MCHCIVGLHWCMRGCGWLSSASVWRIKTAVCVLMKRAPYSASAVDDLTAQIICKILRMAPLLKGMSSFPAMNMCPPMQLGDFGLDKYDALLWIAKTMMLAQ